MMHQAMKNNPSSIGDEFSSFAFDPDEQSDLEIGQELQENEKQIRTAHKHKKKTPSFAEDDFKLPINPKTPNQTQNTHRQKSQLGQNIVTEFMKLD